MSNVVIFDSITKVFDGNPVAVLILGSNEGMTTPKSANVDAIMKLFTTVPALIFGDFLTS
jgi:hypothetical protein